VYRGLNFSDAFGLWPDLKGFRSWLHNSSSGQLLTAVACLSGCRGMTASAQRGIDASNAAFGDFALVAGVGAPTHHLATNKNWLSAARGGPWSPKFARLFERAEMALDDAANKVDVAGHRGPHPREYHQTVYDRLMGATEGLMGEEYATALVRELRAIAKDVTTPGSELNKMITKSQ
jgi:hypothetical protein